MRIGFTSTKFEVGQMVKQRSFLLFIFIVGVKAVEYGAKMELIHWHDPRIRMPPMTRLQSLSEQCESDRVRIERRHVQQVSGQLSMYTGADFRTGQYYVKVKVGSPPQDIVMAADTGSDLTWTNCQRRCGMRGCQKNSSRFIAGLSSSYQIVPCVASLCKEGLSDLFSVTVCPNNTYPCIYAYSYMDGSEATGAFSTETITFDLTNGGQKPLHKVLFGCSDLNSKSFNGAHGILGLGYNNYSFALQAAKAFGGRFTFCLVDHRSPKDVSSHIFFGSHGLKSKTPLKYTKLFLGVIQSAYAVNVTGISIGAKMLSIPTRVWDLNGEGGVVMDTGSSLTHLLPQAYEAVTSELKEALSSLTRLTEDVPLEYCFDTSQGFNRSMVPKLRIHFGDGAVFEPPVENYVIEAAEGVECLGFMSRQWPGEAIIGNIMMQKHLWEYDVVNKKLGFASSSCTH